MGDEGVGAADGPSRTLDMLRARPGGSRLGPDVGLEDDWPAIGGDEAAAMVEREVRKQKEDRQGPSSSSSGVGAISTVA